MRKVKKQKYSTQDVAIGTKHELEHTKDRKIARQIATDHLKEHPMYYRVLPMAEQMMTLEENKGRVPMKKKKRVVARPSGPMWGGTPWD